MQNIHNMQNNAKYAEYAEYSEYAEYLDYAEYLEYADWLKQSRSGSVVPLAMLINIKLRVAISPVFDFAGDPLDGCVAGQCTQDTASDNSS